MVPRRTLAVAVLLLVAGCSGLPSDDGPPDREPYGVDDELEPTLADTGNATRTDHAERLAPGLTTGGVDNASLLVDRHYEALEAAAGNRTYVVAALETWRTGNGSSVRFVEGTIVVDPWDRWHRNLHTAESPEAEPTVTEWWVEPNASLYRNERPDGTVDYRSTGVPSSGPPIEGTLRSILGQAGNASVEARAPNGTSWYRVTANVSDVDDVRDLAFVVRDDGMVDHVSYVRPVEHGPNANVSELRFQFDAPGPASLERPDWFGEALEESDAEIPGNETDDEGETDDERAPDDDGAPEEAGAEPREGEAGAETPTDGTGDESAGEAHPGESSNSSPAERVDGGDPRSYRPR